MSTITDAQVEAAQTSLGHEAVYVGAHTVRRAIEAAYLATTEPGKPESGVLAEAKDEPTQLGEEERSRLRRRIYDDLATDGGGTWATYVCIDISALERAAFEAGKSTALHAEPCEPVAAKEFGLGDRVSKKSGSSWNGHVVGFYSTELTPIGYCVESAREPGSVQIYPEAALSGGEDGR